MPRLLSMPTPAAAAHPGITILLSTYNGNRFLAAQLESFLAQSHENWVLCWRDDGSTDESVAIMRAFADRVGVGRCVESPSSGPHLGAARSFLALLAENTAADALAFADQDDVWLPEKLRHAAEYLTQAGERPMLYCARQCLVDENLQGSRLSALHNTPDFPACLTQNIANGNTLVLNAAAAALVAAVSPPDGTVHDWWSYIVVSACGGTIIFDERPQVLYRLHKNNLIGAAQSMPVRALAAIQRGSDIFMIMMRRHADMLETATSYLSPQARKDLKTIRAALHGGFLPRLAALSCRRFRRRTALENILFGYWFVTGRPERPALQLLGKQSQVAMPHWAPQEGPAAE
jgi:glycosyltransferase involved in cell wall biosynthesis